MQTKKKLSDVRHKIIHLSSACQNSKGQADCPSRISPSVLSVRHFLEHYPSNDANSCNRLSNAKSTQVRKYIEFAVSCARNVKCEKWIKLLSPFSFPTGTECISNSSCGSFKSNLPRSKLSGSGKPFFLYLSAPTKTIKAALTVVHTQNAGAPVSPPYTVSTIMPEETSTASSSAR